MADSSQTDSKGMRALEQSGAGSFFTRKRVIQGALVGCGLFVLLHIGKIFLGGNFHEVVPGQIYRCSQPTGPWLDRIIRRYGIKTVVNLRGCSDPHDWYMAEARACSTHNVSLEDLRFSAGKLPSVYEIRNLIAVLDHGQAPFLFHCFRGVDRTGLAVVIARLLKEDISLDEALRQLHWRYGHLAFGHTGHLDTFFELYREWLRAKGADHSKEQFRQWATDEYVPGACSCTMELLEKSRFLKGKVGKATFFTVRVTNTSLRTWKLSPTSNAGIHLGWEVFDEKDVLLKMGRSGLYDGTVEPGETRDFTVIIPPLKAGHYQLQVDMLEEQHCYFRQVGNEPLDLDLEIR